MSEKKDIHEDLKPSYGDYTHAGFKAGLSWMPGVGGSISEFFSMVITPPLSKRRDEWIIAIHERLLKLEEKLEDFSIENLKENDLFISVFLHATIIAMRTHQKEKIEALRNAVINTAISLPFEDNIQFIYLNLVERYTPLHLKLLKKMDDFYPKDVHKLLLHSSGSFIKSDISELMPELQNNPELSIKLERDLVNDGLIYDERLPDEVINSKTNQSRRTTIFGQNFLEFIKKSF